VHCAATIVVGRACCELRQRNDGDFQPASKIHKNQKFFNVKQRSTMKKVQQTRGKSYWNFGRSCRSATNFTYSIFTTRTTTYLFPMIWPPTCFRKITLLDHTCRFPSGSVSCSPMYPLKAARWPMPGLLTFKLCCRMFEPGRWDLYDLEYCSVRRMTLSTKARPTQWNRLKQRSLRLQPALQF
jgi:hypothetical protein